MEVEKTEESSGGGVTFQANFSVGEKAMLQRHNTAIGGAFFQQVTISEIRILQSDQENYSVEYKVAERMRGWLAEALFQPAINQGA